MADVRVLIVDDQELFRRGLALLLDTVPGIRVVGHTGDPDDAVRQVADLAAEVVLLEVRVGGVGGVATCSSLRQAQPSARIVMLTDSDAESDLYDSVNAGAAGYLLKDSTFEELGQAIRVVADGQSLISPSMAVKLIDEFKQMSKPQTRSSPGTRLTPREIEVLALVARGLNNREVARELFISENTVKNHVRNILEKLQMHSRVEAVMFAVRERILEVP
ncbi:response regulator transcription factor [soil metagenome]